MKMKTLTFLGHSAVFIETTKGVVAIDPWLEGNPLCPASYKNPTSLDLIILTHGHSDHAGEAARLAKQTGAHIIATWELTMVMISEGVAENKVNPMNKGGTLEHQGLKITLTQALHSSSYDSARGTLYAGEPCGIVLRDGVRSIYHAGDTALFSDMRLISEMYKPDLALLPIGDRFTMGPQEASKAVQFIGCKTAIPIHYKTFDMLTGSADEFKKHCSKLDVEVLVLEPGQSYALT